MAGREEDGAIWPSLLHCHRYPHAVNPTHYDVCKDKIGPNLLDEGESLFPAIRHQRVITALVQDYGEGVNENALVIDNKDHGTRIVFGSFQLDRMMYFISWGRLSHLPRYTPQDVANLFHSRIVALGILLVKINTHLFKRLIDPQSTQDPG